MTEGFWYCKTDSKKKRLEHVIAGYLRQVLDKNDWLYEGQRDSMGLDRDTLAKVKSPQCARTKGTLWTRGSV